MGQTYPFQRWHPAGAPRLASQHASPKREVFTDRQRGLQRVRMAKIMRLLAEAELRIASFDAKTSLRQGQEAGKRAQQARLAGAVWPKDDQRVARADFKTKLFDKRRPPRSSAMSVTIRRILPFIRDFVESALDQGLCSLAYRIYL